MPLQTILCHSDELQEYMIVSMTIFVSLSFVPERFKACTLINIMLEISRVCDCIFLT
jgi:hypothetical protein